MREQIEPEDLSLIRNAANLIADERIAYNPELAEVALRRLANKLERMSRCVAPR